ncbi:type I-G CRISPR-associated protein, Cas3-extension family [Tahibacter caeni]|uniref:type I-G CRISPR-associated protein, Cas3-extension family n=1 Tax=Tahibacter caeni TaxID=1453545 RepID=UPI0021487429|nr:hypothetical protein [Tahibacter caeni]
MAELTCPALLGSHPLGALASFGLLRLVAASDPGARLHFTLTDDWVAVLGSTRYATLDALIEHLSEWAISAPLDRIFGWADDVRMPSPQYRALLDDAVAHGDSDLVAFLCAFAADGAIDGSKKQIKPSAFYMVSGQQSFLGGARNILSQCRAQGRQVFEEALVGPWRYATREHSLGWDPGTERLYALRHRAPTAEKPCCIAGAMLLGLWALPLFPPVSERGRERTIGFVRDGGERHFSWPVFTSAIGIDELRSLLQTRQWSARGEAQRRSGIAAVYRSRRSEFGQGYAVLRAAQPEPAPRGRDR